jgi:hypothetical protein
LAASSRLHIGFGCSSSVCAEPIQVLAWPGPGEVHWRGISPAGIPLADAKIMVDIDDDRGSDEQVELIVKVCTSCAEAANLRPRVGLIPDEVPFYGEPGLHHE